MERVSVWEFNQIPKKDSSIKLACYSHKGFIIVMKFKKGKVGVHFSIHKYVKSQYFEVWQEKLQEVPKSINEYLHFLSLVIDNPAMEWDRKLARAVLNKIGG